MALPLPGLCGYNTDEEEEGARSNSSDVEMVTATGPGRTDPASRGGFPEDTTQRPLADDPRALARFGSMFRPTEQAETERKKRRREAEAGKTAAAASKNRSYSR